MRFNQKLEECTLSAQRRVLNAECKWAAVVSTLFWESPSSFSHFPEGKNAVLLSTAWESSRLLHQVTAPAPPATSLVLLLLQQQWPSRQMGCSPVCSSISTHSWCSASTVQIIVINLQFVGQWIRQHMIQTEKTSNMRRLCHMLPLKSHVLLTL